MNTIGRNGLGLRSVLLGVLAASIVTIGCGENSDQGEVTVQSSALNGDLIPIGGPLTRRTFDEPIEANRETDTDLYYQSVRTGVHGNDGGHIKPDLDTFAKFKQRYQLDDGPAVTYYYNRGDLGIGREMHCVDHVNYPDIGEIACYVTNFAAGDDGSEFTFGLSSNIAFANMHANHSFATVAMVFRNLAPAGSKDRVFFVVYGPDGSLLYEAALDRHAISFATGQGTPGVNFNLHIPSNCASCHGGYYDKATHSHTGGLFLPFDLDQFDYENSPGWTRADQLNAFKFQNLMAWKVAALSPGIGDPIKAQIDLWYQHNYNENPLFASFGGSFDSNAVPAGWVGFESIYRSVVRGSCRSCHLALKDVNGKQFDTEAAFRLKVLTYWTGITSKQMPHALQSLREFWQSSRAESLAAYLTNVGHPDIADAIRSTGPGGAVTLDPPQLMVDLQPIGM